MVALGKALDALFSLCRLRLCTCACVCVLAFVCACVCVLVFVCIFVCVRFGSGDRVELHDGVLTLGWAPCKEEPEGRQEVLKPAKLDG